MQRKEIFCLGRVLLFKKNFDCFTSSPLPPLLLPFLFDFLWQTIKTIKINWKVLPPTPFLSLKKQSLLSIWEKFLSNSFIGIYTIICLRDTNSICVFACIIYCCIFTYSIIYLFKKHVLEILLFLYIQIYFF